MLVTAGLDEAHMKNAEAAQAASALLLIPGLTGTVHRRNQQSMSGESASAARQRRDSSSAFLLANSSSLMKPLALRSPSFSIAVRISALAVPPV